MKRNEIPVPSEDSEQSALFRWAEYQKRVYPELSLMYAIPNGGYRHIKTAVAMKRTGTKAGVPDICFPVPRGCFHGMYIEMKRKNGGVVSEAQSEWISALTKQGYYCVVCKGWESATEEIKKYLSGTV